jgi:hypothetical protein
MDGYDIAAIHEIAHQFGLIDGYRFNLKNDPGVFNAGVFVGMSRWLLNL